MSSTLVKPFSFILKGSSIIGFTDNVPKNLIIPSVINKIKVTSIGYVQNNTGRGVFENTNIKSVTFEGKLITNIDMNAFKNCSELTSIILPDSIITIGNGVFNGCSNLTNIIIPPKVTKISRGLFSNSGLTDITIPNNVTIIERDAFYNCINLTNINIPSGIKKIEQGAFMNCSKLTDFIIPDGINIIGQNTFMNCTNLTDIIIPDNVTNIENMAFANCSNLTNITLNNLIKTIGKNVFSYISNNITIYHYNISILALQNMINSLFDNTANIKIVNYMELFKDRGCWTEKENIKTISNIVIDIGKIAVNNRLKYAIKLAVEKGYDTIGFQNNALHIGKYDKSNNNAFKYDKLGKYEGECLVFGKKYVNRVYSIVEPYYIPVTEEEMAKFKDRGCWKDLDDTGKIVRAISDNMINLKKIPNLIEENWIRYAVRMAIDKGYDTFGFQNNSELFLGNYDKTNYRYRYDYYGKYDGPCLKYGASYVNRVYSVVDSFTLVSSEDENKFIDRGCWMDSRDPTNYAISGDAIDISNIYGNQKLTFAIKLAIEKGYDTIGLQNNKLFLGKYDTNGFRYDKYGKSDNAVRECRAYGSTFTNRVYSLISPAEINTNTTEYFINDSNNYMNYILIIILLFIIYLLYINSK